MNGLRCTETIAFDPLGIWDDSMQSLDAWNQRYGYGLMSTYMQDSDDSYLEFAG